VTFSEAGLQLSRSAAPSRGAGGVLTRSGGGARRGRGGLAGAERLGLGLRDLAAAASSSPPTRERSVRIA
jgi:hypothetical protein